MNIEEAINELKCIRDFGNDTGFAYGKSQTTRLQEAIDIVLKELDKKDKVIDLMSELLCSIHLIDELGQDSWNWNKEQMKEYFYK